MIKVCQVVASAGRGGLEKHVEHLTARLADDCQVSVIAPPECAPTLDPRVSFHPFDFSGSRHSPLALWRLWRLIRAIDPDIVHCQASKAAAMVSRFARFMRPSFVATIHNQKRSVGMFAHCDGVIAVSRDLAKRVGHDRVRVIYNGLDPSGFTVAPRPSRARPLALAIGRLAPAKGFDLLLEAWAGIDADLHIVGEGDERDRLTGLIARFGLAERVHLLGYCEDIPALLQDADLVVVSSRREGFSYVVCEALMAGRCVVSTDVPVANELLPAGFIARIDAADLRSKIQAALEDLGGAYQTCAPLFDYARRELTLAGMADATLGYYRELLAGGATSSPR